MKIRTELFGGDDRVQLLSNGGTATPVPAEWKPILGSCDALVVIPDMHMYLHDSPLDNFHFGAATMLDFLGLLSRRKEEMEDEGRTLRVYQLGDLFEMRFPGARDSGANATADEIRLSHADYDTIVSMLNGLRTHFVYGNHDFEVRHFPGFRFGAYEGKVYLEHGFAASAWTDNPDHPLWDAAMLVFRHLRETEQFFGALEVATGLVGKDAVRPIGVTSGAVEHAEFPVADYPEDLARHYAELLSRDPDMMGARLAVIGHTHMPHVHEATAPDGTSRVVLDAGAWTEGRSDFVVVTDDEYAVCRYARGA